LTLINFTRGSEPIKETVEPTTLGITAIQLPAQLG